MLNSSAFELKRINLQNTFPLNTNFEKKFIYHHFFKFLKFPDNILMRKFLEISIKSNHVTKIGKISWLFKPIQFNIILRQDVVTV